MSVIDAEIEVDVPLRATYDQWTQFEEFPAFMQGVEEVRQLDDTRLHWVASIAGVHREWDARITEQIPDQMVAWTSTEGTRNDGLVTFEAEGAHRTRVTLRLDLEPEGALETVGEALGLVRARAKGDLQRFKAYIEERRLPSGAWRGEVVAGEVVADDRDAGVADLGDVLPGSQAPPLAPLGERAASTGGMVDLDRVLGTIPVVLVFTEPLVSDSSRAVLGALGEHLAEFGRERVQVLGVARVDVDEAMAGTDGIAGNLRVLADPAGELAARFDVEYRTDRPVTVLIGADGRHEATWVDRPTNELADDISRRLEQYSGMDHHGAR